MWVHQEKPVIQLHGVQQIAVSKKSWRQPLEATHRLRATAAAAVVAVTALLKAVKAMVAIYKVVLHKEVSHKEVSHKAAPHKEEPRSHKAEAYSQFTGLPVNFIFQFSFHRQ